APAVRSGGKEERRPRAGHGAVAEGDPPEAGQHDRPAVPAAELSVERPAGPSPREDVDPSAAEVADEESAAERAEPARRDGQPPRLVERAHASDAGHKRAIEVELVDVSARGRVVAVDG